MGRVRRVGSKVWGACALAIAVVCASTAGAQPGPSRSVTVAEARAGGEAWVRARAHVGTPTEQLAAAVDVARRFEHLQVAHLGLGSGGAQSIEPGAEAAFRQLTGFDFAAPQMRSAWRDCMATAARLHATDATARECAGRVLLRSPQQVVLEMFSLDPPRGFVGDDANAASAQYDRTRTALTRTPSDASLRRDLAAMQLASFDFDGAIETLEPLDGQVDIDLAVAVAHLGAGHLDGAQHRLMDLARRAPDSPAVHFDLGMLLAARRVEPYAAEPALDARHGLDALLRFLCLRASAPAVAANALAWERAAVTASELDHEIMGEAYRAASATLPHPPPLLPNDALPPGWHVPVSAPPPHWTCPDVMRGAVLR